MRSQVGNDTTTPHTRTHPIHSYHWCHNQPQQQFCYSYIWVFLQLCIHGKQKEIVIKTLLIYIGCMFIKNSHKKQLLYNVICVMSLVNNDFITFIYKVSDILYVNVKIHIIIIQMGTLQFTKLHSKFNIS